ncbi:MAG: hypothetical protein A2600_00215 [Candidatus Lambdaproteobacteria bacterium RIFOXYD1_FULL_56_27]|uniref:Flagellar hook-length control protein-like C-terminal domain-containing protein n=1 Tax=Candidatus Lambdaproteobacteria bacterium RIFOXYD2_FULL_56_26 TaxID=1817773 RepID=A0A1F6GPN4_9PROT|nr:MAG: hypothetical protein A2557_04335 [Candidatus Lambdaproteobacteria bacterium RIFOXYD2_FULL_56_26]OGH03941.1 MAG: hypothetical protein A2426_07560 [Candidatus Lambdaproteobacteria bacterium RIFOXYC1_FULL_56_13]OGH06198.1 MAG: hypothetical protein A2600_00215 [Candidatus Lambdaproteobacteria bacterium RIFOXYD1_FULL_56_27]
MNIAQGNLNAKTQFQTDTVKHQTPADLEKFTGQLVAAQVDLGMLDKNEVKAETLKASKELFEEKKTKKQLAQETSDRNFVQSFVTEHKVKSAQEQSQWSNNEATESSTGRKMTNQQAQFKFQKGMEEIQGRTAEKIGEQKTMEKRGHLFNPALAQAEAEANKPKAQFTEAHAQAQAAKEGGQAPEGFNPTFNNQPSPEGAIAQRRNQHQQFDQQRNPSGQKGNQAQIASVSKLGGAQPLAQAAAAFAKEMNQTGMAKTANTEVPGLNLAAPKTSLTKTEAKDLKAAVPAPKPEMTEKPDLKHLGTNLRMMLNAKRTEMTLQLKPEHLGKVEIKLAKNGETYTGKMKVDSVEAKEGLEKLVPELRDNLFAQGIKVESFTIELKDQPQSGFAQADQGGGQSQNQGAQNASKPEERRGFEPRLTVPDPVEAKPQSPSDNLSIYA